jgi:hypothetical protein
VSLSEKELRAMADEVLYETEGEIVVSIPAVVEMEAAQEPQIEQPGHDLLDILRLIVVPCIHQHPGLWSH